jgi:hypothetical protein
MQNIVRCSIPRAIITWSVFLLTAFGAAQINWQVTPEVEAAPGQGKAVELLGTVTANQVSDGLGFVVPQDYQDWEFAAAAAAGATHVRFQCAWGSVEKQSSPPSNVSLGFAQDPNCALGFASAAKYGMKATVVAAYGPPYHQILSVTIPTGAAVGATSLEVQFASGVGGDSLANLSYPYDYIMGSDGSMFTAVHNYEGSFISGVVLRDSTHATLILASAVTTPLSANTTTQYAINEVLYPSPASFSPNDPSVIAYSNYVSWLARDMASRGIQGEIEIWNEPPWPDDLWDNRGDLYDVFPATQAPGPQYSGMPNFGFAANLQKGSLPEGISLIWGGTEKSGSNSLLFSTMHDTTGLNVSQPTGVITSESFHPYGNTPEESMWLTSCLEGTVHPYPLPPDAYQNCFLPGEKTGSNFMWAAQYSLVAQTENSSYGIAHSITETGSMPPAAGLRTVQARFEMRQFIGFQADGISPVEFYAISDGTSNDPSFGFVGYSGSGSTYIPYPAYTAISGFMADVRLISRLPVTEYSSSMLASIAAYAGSYPLSTVHIVGSRDGATSNSDMLVVWQRSYTPGCGVSGQPNAASCDNSWIQQASPQPGSVTVNIPTGMQVSSVLNIDTRALVTYTISGQQLAFNVADDPLEILIDPAVTKGQLQPPTNLSATVQ